MFHRVKSERQPQDEDQNEVVHDQEEASQDAEDQAEESSDNTSDEQDSAQDETPRGNLDIPGTPSSYQRGVQSSAGRPTGALGGTGYGAASNIPKSGPTTTEASAENDRRLTIGRGITMSGEIEACDYLLVEGTVEAALKGARALDIAESGTFYGTVEIDDATVAGRFEGDLTVSGRLTVKSSGVITGTISYSELAVEAGAVIEGSLTPMGAEAVASSSKSSGSSKDGAKGKKGKRPEPANSDGQLFQATAAAE